MKKTLKALLTVFSSVLLVSLLLTACGGGESSDDSDSSASKSSSSKEKVADKIVLWEQMEQKQVDKFEELVAKFEEDTGIEVERVHYSTEDLRSQFQTAVLSGQGPDVIFGPNDNAGPMSVGKLIVPLNEMMPSSFWSKIDPQTLDSVKIDGQIYGLPVVNGNNIALIYNKKFVKSEPQSLEDLYELDLPKGVYPIVYFDIEPYWFVPFLGAFGGQVFDDSGNITLDTPAMKKALQYVQDMKYKWKVTPIQQDYGVMDSLFKEGKAAAVLNGSWSWSEYKEALGDDMGLVTFPTIEPAGAEGVPYFGSKMFSVSANVRDDAKKNAIKKFFDFIASDEYLLPMSLIEKQAPATTALLSHPDVKADPMIEMAMKQIKKGTPMPIRAEMRAIWDGMRPSLEAVLANNSTPEQAAAEMQKKAEDLAKSLTD